MKKKVLPIQLLLLGLLFRFAHGEDDKIASSPRRKRQDANDVTTVLLVDNQGRSTFGRFLSVKPDVGLLTSTARTFIQEGVTTEFATQILGTTLDNGRFYAHLLTKSSRVVYDNPDLNTRLPSEHSQWKFDHDHNALSSSASSSSIHKGNQFLRNTDFISPNKVEPYLVFPTAKPKLTDLYKFMEKGRAVPGSDSGSYETNDDEILKESPSNNARVPYEESDVSEPITSQNNIKIFQIHPKQQHLNNAINHKEIEFPRSNDNNNNRDQVGSKNLQDNVIDELLLSPSKVKEHDDLPTFTVRNDFSPSGFSLLGDLPDFDTNTERNKATSSSGGTDRKAKLLFRKPSIKDQQINKDLPTVTYSGFADFTTVVGDTVIVFAPFSTVDNTKPRFTAIIKPTSTLRVPPMSTTLSLDAANLPKQSSPIKSMMKLPLYSAKSPSPSARPSLPSRPSPSLRILPPTLRPSFTIRRPSFLKTPLHSIDHPQISDTKSTPDDVEDNGNKAKTNISSIVIDASDRQRDGTTTAYSEQYEDMDAKSAVLAHEQQISAYEQSTTPQLESPSLVSTKRKSTTSAIRINSNAIEPSEVQVPPMLSTPSNDDIAKILASLQAQQNQQATEPLQSTATRLSTTASSSTSSSNDKSETSGGVTTIFFDDEPYDVTSSTTSTATNIITTSTSAAPTAISSVPDAETTVEDDIKNDILEGTTLELTTSSTTISDQELTDPYLTTTDDTTAEPTEATTLDDSENSDDVACSDGTQVVPTSVLKTLTYLTTFFIPFEDSTTTSIKSNQVVSTEIAFSTRICDSLSTTPTITHNNGTELPPTTTEQQQTETLALDSDDLSTTTTASTTTTDHVTVDDSSTYESTVPAEATTTESSDAELTEGTTEDDEEIEVLFKTLYTTYTYLTTYFQESTSSIASRKVVITNVITSTLDPSTEMTDPAVAGLFSRDDVLVSSYKSKPPTFEDIPDISPTRVVEQSSSTVLSNFDEDINQDNGLQQSSAATPSLNDNGQIVHTSNAIRTYYTTYTYFTTIFVDGETEISSRTEVFTNYVTPTVNLHPTTVVRPLKTQEPKLLAHNNIKLEYDEDEENEDDSKADLLRKKIVNLNVVPNMHSYKSTISRKNSGSSYSTLSRSGNVAEPDILNLNQYETIATMVTDVRSTTSTGERRLLDNVLDDQIVAESNNDSDILPSPTLLLQTSYTTFTYFTTMYQGTTSSNVVSRLETITNVVTETLTPTQTLSKDDLDAAPVTYYTTFTYWTTLYKDGTTKVTSREETQSNIAPPTATDDSITTIVPSSTAIATSSAPPQSTQITDNNDLGKDEKTTYYTTYTYYTTSYIDNSTVLNSRLETVTNVLNETDGVNQLGRTIGPGSVQNEIQPTSTLATGLLSTIVSTVDNSGVKTVYSTDVFGTFIDGQYAQVVESTSTVLPSTPTPALKKPIGVVSLNEGKIIDADRVTTVFYTTQAIGTYIDNLYAQVIESTSSVKVDEEKKSGLVSSDVGTHRTGLVRLIDGSIVQNGTSTLYQSKVIGTIIDGRYAQIIESTSSFIVEKTKEPLNNDIQISASTTQQLSGTTKTTPLSPSPVAIEASLTDSTQSSDEAGDDDETATEEGDVDEESENDDREDGDPRKKKSRLTFQTRKRTFTPVIRPFASRPRPTFAPRRKSGGAGAATTITRSDFTPTVTAVPASKTGSRFGARKNSAASSSASPTSSSSSRRFIRPKSGTAFSNNGVSSSAFGTTRGGKSTSRITPTVSGSRKNFRLSTAIKPTSTYSGNARFARVRPTSALGRPFTSKAGDQSVNDDENDLLNHVTDNPTDFTDSNNFEEEDDSTLAVPATTQSSRRGQNPLLKLRRPPLLKASSSTKAASPTKSTTRAKTNGRLSTTAKPARSTSRPLPPSLQGRSRLGNGLLIPRRGLFTTTPTPAVDEDFDGDDDDVDNEDEDADYDSSNTDTQTAKVPVETTTTRRGRSFNNLVALRPFKFRQRTKRETNYSKFRRPSRISTPAPISREEIETEPPKVNGRFKSRGRANGNVNAQKASATPKRISPSRATLNQGRSQFTLREKDKTTSRSNFRRGGSTQSLSRRTTTASSRPKAPKLRSSYQSEQSRKSTNANSGRSSSNSKRRNSQNSGLRSRSSAEHIDNFVVPNFDDGTITVTYSIPTEATIPVVNGKITQYKNIVTAKYSTDVLDPDQYSTILNSIGRQVTVLVGESTAIAPNGATEITQFILNETPTTTVIFTPTYIRGHKTSYSHVLPSTAYGVETVVNTIQPALSAQAPLANILLSQLLLGNPGVATNPLLAFPNAGTAAANTPTTEFKTRTTTYVTTVTNQVSTVLPITFRGKEILTTIIDSSVNVITATEFLTDTVVVTPTVAQFGGNGLNSLLLPLLLQQQQQNQQQQQQQLLQPQQQQLLQSLGTLIPDDKGTINLDATADIENSEELIDQNIAESVTTVSSRRKNSSRKKSKGPKRIVPAPLLKETSIVTLYVSGKTPGEFSTILSTVVVDDGDNRRKRYVDVRPTQTLNLFDRNDEESLESAGTIIETQSLESVLGDVRQYVVTQIPELFVDQPTSSTLKLNRNNEVGLGEFTPLMPMVETLKNSKRGDAVLLDRHQLEKTTVSNLFGYGDLHPQIRIKRYLEPINNDRIDVVVSSSLPMRRVVKKLIRIEPVRRSNETVTTLLDKNDGNNSTHNLRRRKRIKIKTIKRRRMPSPSSRSHPRSSKVLLIKKRRPIIKLNATSSSSSLSSITPTLPAYEPFFPELSESIDESTGLFLKTTVLSHVFLETTTNVVTKNRTYTLIVTRQNQDEQTVISTTEIRPQTKTVTLTESRTTFTTLTLLSLEASETLLLLPLTTVEPSKKGYTQYHTNTKELQEGNIEEARYNLATRIMSNGVEVIVANDKSTLPGEPDIKRTLYKPITLKPSIISEQVMMSLPQQISNAETLLSSLYPNQFVTKTCLTTFTYLTTYLENGTTTVSSHEQVISNIATEERNTKIAPTTSTSGIVLTQYPNLSKRVFFTTYTYLNTIVEDNNPHQSPLVVTSIHTVMNTVTAPDNYLSQLQSSGTASPVRDTNTYYSTIVSLENTRDPQHKQQSELINTTITQVVITESVPPKSNSIMTSYVALEEMNPKYYSTKDVLKTYFVTYTYYNTMMENGQNVVRSNVSTSSEVVTEKMFLSTIRKTNSVINTSPISIKSTDYTSNTKKKKVDVDGENFQIFATKTYVTTYTYFTTLLQDNDMQSTLINSHTREVENKLMETLDPNYLNQDYLQSLRSELMSDNSFKTIKRVGTLKNGENIEITIVNNDQINPTKVLPIDRTQFVQDIVAESSRPNNVITGSTIIFFDDDEVVPSTASTTIATPKLTTSSKYTTKNHLNSLLSAEIVSTSVTKPKHPNKSKDQSKSSTANHHNKKKVKTKVFNETSDDQEADQIGLDSLHMDSLYVLKPVINAMAGLIKSNLNRRNDSLLVHTEKNELKKPQSAIVDEQQQQNHAPLYIPLGDLEIAESQNFASIHINDWETDDKKHINNNDNIKSAQEQPLFNGAIPISPGEIITANSDVIVGRPGRIGPRVPPLDHQQQATDNANHPSHIPLDNVQSANNIEEQYVQKKDDYVGPPPPVLPVKIPLRSSNFVRGNKLKDHKMPPVKSNYNNNLHIQFPNANNNNMAGKPFAQVHANIQPSPVIPSHPEIIERSTGQPLLINLQPSQVAFVKIPYNRTTALIYGGSTEAHKNGQYFNDPSPYPDQYSSLSINTGGFLINHNHNNQEQILKEIINIDPLLNGEVISPEIRPTKPWNKFMESRMPPISFGMVHHGHDINAHVINHGIHGTPFKVVKNEKEDTFKNYINMINFMKLNESAPVAAPTPATTTLRPKQAHTRPPFILRNKNKEPLDKFTDMQPPPPPPPPSEINLLKLNNKFQQRPFSKFNSDMLADGTRNITLADYLIPPPPLQFKSRPFTKKTTDDERNKIKRDFTRLPSSTTRSHLPIPIPLYTEVPPAQNPTAHTSNNDSNDLISEDSIIVQESNVHSFATKGPSSTTSTSPTTTRVVTPGTTSSILKNPFIIHAMDSDDDYTFNQPPTVQRPRPFETIYNIKQGQKPNGIKYHNSNNNVMMVKGPSENNFGMKKPTKITHIMKPTTPLTPALINSGLNRRHRNHSTVAIASSTAPVFPTKNRPATTTTTKTWLKNRRPNTRPIVTSMPIDSFDIDRKPLPNFDQPSHQTEVPFVSHSTTFFNSNNNNNKINYPLNDNSHNDNNRKDLTISAMEVLKPPPLQEPPNGLVPAEVVLPPPVPVPSPEEHFTFYTSTLPSSTTRRRRPFGSRRTTRKPMKSFSSTTAKSTTVSLNTTYSSTVDIVKSINNLESTTLGNKLKVNDGDKSVQAGNIPNKTSTNNNQEIKSTISSNNTTSTTTTTTVPPKTVTSIISEERTKATPVNNVKNNSTRHGTTSIINKKPLRDNTIHRLEPTKYVTVTKTSTIVRTTVVKTQNGPSASPTMTTISITKTEKSTLIDTVTEFHTLVKPTSVTQTITTTINSTPTIITSITTPQTLQTAIQYANDHNTSDISNDSVFIVVNDHNDHERGNAETETRDDHPNQNDANHIILGGVLIAPPPALSHPKNSLPIAPSSNQNECSPTCLATRNELCQRLENVMQCVCRAGFARMFPDHPCKPIYTYSMKIELEKYRDEPLDFNEALFDNSSTEFLHMAAVIHDGLDRTLMQSDLRDIYQSVYIHGFEPLVMGNGTRNEGLISKFLLQLSDNSNEYRLEEVFRKYLRANNFSLGGTQLFASKRSWDNLLAEDFDECVNGGRFHDCSEHAHCFNLPGTYTCSCKEGYTDLTENHLYPGRVCSSDVIGCAQCHYHGTCYSSQPSDGMLCECFQWYAGDNCQINLKVLLIGLITLGIILAFLLLIVCLGKICCCRRHRPKVMTTVMNIPSRGNLMPHRLLLSHNRNRNNEKNRGGSNATDRRAIVVSDSSSESQSSSSSEMSVIVAPVAFNNNRQRPMQMKGALKKPTVTTAVVNSSDREHNSCATTNHTNSFSEQKDRSLTVMIPRAKYHPAAPTSPHLNPSGQSSNNHNTNRKSNAQVNSNEAKLLSYLDAGPSPSKSKNTNFSCSENNKYSDERRSSGALISAGFEVSATVGGHMGNMGTILTLYGTEGEIENNDTDTYTQEISSDLLSTTATKSQFTTFRKTLHECEIEDPLSNWLSISPKVGTTVSEARSCDETTIQPPTKCCAPATAFFESKSSFHHQNDEANTMAERDVGSTFLLPHTHLYKPDKGSDISGFDSL